MARPKKMLNVQEGHLTKEQQIEKKLQEEIIQTGTEQLKPPKWLRDKTAKKEFKRLVEQFKTIGIISNLDLNNLGAYCNAYSFYLESTTLLNKEPLTIEYTNKAGATNIIENPLIKIQLKYSDEMKKYSSLLGLTIDSRLKMATIKLNETKKEITSDFGDI
ncbi:phage terminase small subunit P27 family [Clostridium botulinum]|uniref:phage terminase small subunit P27 family n=1 Tax=Clostridium botulinum TaxID=1491 RepID=UPI0013F0690C|nr:phage terminase small subunit P27 family [Clostridium botulinum]MBN1051628.1 phage terminase small subunit P27 family [Clostridium botulinum]MBN1061304.1 phage terminase small subunit P27 family [Clostridium botulinum]MCS6110720.1 phage terminase small subunit P27 family [Clostridium botulinum]NFE11250.1 phage terminase small subunit P27 family [Clostridium botulinum]NFH88823.1 phage terminase small subunit P27 family [Clostridium botulinum]